MGGNYFADDAGPEALYANPPSASASPTGIDWSSLGSSLIQTIGTVASTAIAAKPATVVTAAPVPPRPASLGGSSAMPLVLGAVGVGVLFLFMRKRK